MALPVIAKTYERMGRVFTRVFGQTCVMTTKTGESHVIDAVYSPEYVTGVIRGTATQTRDAPLLSLRRSQLVEIFGEGADIIISVQDATFAIPDHAPGVTYTLDDVVDDTKIMLEGRLAQKTLTNAGDSGLNAGRRVNSILG